MQQADLSKLTDELLTVDSLFMSAGIQHFARRWEYGMALRAAKQVPLEAVPLALDVGGTGSPLRAMLERDGFLCQIIDPKEGTTLAEARVKKQSAPLVTCVSVIEHVDDVLSFICDLEQVVKPGGVLFLTSDAWDKEGAEDKAHWHWDRKRIWTPSTWRALVENFESMGMKLLGEADWRWQGEYLEYQSESVHWGYSLCCMTLRKEK
jgi:SAM-dependent methyltransferase